MHPIPTAATIHVECRLKLQKTTGMRNAAIMILPEESLVSELTDGIQGTDPVQLLPVTQS